MSAVGADAVPAPARAPVGDRLDRQRLFVYALPAAAGALVSTPLQAYVTGFYSTEMALPLALVGVALSLTRLSDIFTDILLGMFSDGLRTRWGRRKPMIAVAVPVAVVSVWMLFVPPQSVSILYVLGWIIALNLAISAVEVPYQAWGAELSEDYEQRTRVTSWRTIALTLGSFLALSIPFFLERAGQGGPRNALFGMAVAHAVLLPLFFLPLLLTVRERAPRDAQTAAPPFKESVAILWRSRAFRIMAIGLLLFAGGKSVSGALHLIFITAVVEARELFATLLILENVVGLAGVPVWMWLARRWGKHRAMMGAALWSGFWSLPLFFVGPGDGWLFVGILSVRAFSLTSFVMLIPSMTADAVDEDTLAAGRERTGVFFGAQNFFFKASLAVGILVGTSLPAMFGFQPSDVQHDPEGLLALRIVYAVIGPALVVASAFVYGRFPITRERQQVLRAAIAARTAGAAA